MTADYIHDGVTGASGHVDEPYLALTPRPDLLFPAYLPGTNSGRKLLFIDPRLKLDEYRGRRPALCNRQAAARRQMSYELHLIREAAEDALDAPRNHPSVGAGAESRTARRLEGRREAAPGRRSAPL